MRRLSPQAARQLDREVRVWYFRPFMLAAAGMGAFCLVFGVIALLGDRIQRDEWDSSPLQEGEAICVSSQLHQQRVGIWWVNTFRIGSVERTSSDYDGCIAGRHYALSYQVGRSGHMRVNSGKLL